MITQLLSAKRLKEMFIEILVSQTNKVSKVSKDSVLNAIAYGVGKIAQKALKDIAIVESQLFPESSFGQYLDQILKRRGLPRRFEASASSTHVRVFATPGTVYQQGIHTFTGSHGIIFNIEKTVTVPSVGYDYVKVRSQTTGLKTAVDPYTLVQVTPTPAGHKSCTNEYRGQNGVDNEIDDLVKNRLRNAINMAATDTLTRLEQVFMKINSNVLKVLYFGATGQSQIRLGIVTQTGIALTQGEFDEIISKCEKFFSLTDLRPYGSKVSGVVLENVEYQYIDVDYRVQLFQNANIDDVRKLTQIAFSKYVDFRFWDVSKKVEWDELLKIAKQTQGVKYIPDSYFNPSQDITILPFKLPRFRGFIMRDMDGNVLTDTAGAVPPVFYQNDFNNTFVQTTFSSL